MIFIHSLRRGRTDVIDIMNLRPRRVLRLSGILHPQQVKTRSVVYLDHGGEWIGECRIRTGGGGAAPVGERCFQQTALNSLRVGDLFKKLAQKMEEADVVAMYLPPIISV